MRFRALVATTLSLAIAACSDDGSATTPETTSTSSEEDASGGPTSPTTGISDTLQTTTSEESESGSASTDSSTSSATSSASTSTEDDSSSGRGPVECRLLLVEALYDGASADDQFQWVKLYNPCDTTFDLSTYALGWGGPDYGNTLQLELSVSAGGCFVVGGPMSSADNGSPSYEQFADFDPDLDLATRVGGGIALFDVAAGAIDADTVPIDAVVYGPNNDNDLIDESGSPVDAPHVDNPPSGGSIRRVDFAGSWETTETPSPSECPPF